MIKLGTPAALPGQLTRSSVSESDYANLDDLYDATSDHFTGQSVIIGSTQPLTITGTSVEILCQRDRIASYANTGIAIAEMSVRLSHSGILSKQTVSKFFH